MTTTYTPRPLTRAPSACVQGGTHAQVLCWTNVPRCEGCGAVCHLQAQNIWLHVELNGKKIIWDVGLSSLSITSGTREHKKRQLDLVPSSWIRERGQIWVSVPRLVGTLETRST